jgi:hypothetical protein
VRGTSLGVGEAEDVTDEGFIHDRDCSLWPPGTGHFRATATTSPMDSPRAVLPAAARTALLAAVDVPWPLDRCRIFAGLHEPACAPTDLSRAAASTRLLGDATAPVDQVRGETWGTRDRIASKLTGGK